MKKLVFVLIALSTFVAAQAQDLVILHLNDTHSHVDPERSGKNVGSMI